LGRDEFQVFLDRNDIEWGNHWRRCILGGLEQSAVLIPVLSPRYLNSTECRNEFQAFIVKEQREYLSASPSADDALILPLLFLSLPDGLVDEIADAAKERQWEKIEGLSIRGKKLENVANSGLIRRLAQRLIKKFGHIRELSIEQTTASAFGLNSIEFLVRQLESASSELVSWPATMPTGHWLDRTELNDLILSINQLSSSHVLIGPPGVGKSALLARLARFCQNAGHAVLAIKADFLPVEIDSPAALSSRILGRNQDLGETVIRLAKHRRVVVIVDQLDARHISISRTRKFNDECDDESGTRELGKLKLETHAIAARLLEVCTRRQPIRKNGCQGQPLPRSNPFRPVHFRKWKTKSTLSPSFCRSWCQYFPMPVGTNRSAPAPPRCDASCSGM
jgi:hypothetical protein